MNTLSSECRKKLEESGVSVTSQSTVFDLTDVCNGVLSFMRSKGYSRDEG